MKTLSLIAFVFLTACGASNEPTTSGGGATTLIGSPGAVVVGDVGDGSTTNIDASDKNEEDIRIGEGAPCPHSPETCAG